MVVVSPNEEEKKYDDHHPPNLVDDIVQQSSEEDNSSKDDDSDAVDGVTDGKSVTVSSKIKGLKLRLYNVSSLPLELLVGWDK